MSGVGITGLIANQPGTVTPYPTQDPALELGGYRSVADTTARDAIPANFRALGMEVTTTADGMTWQLLGGLLNANWQLKPGQAPFKATYYVDQTFAGTSTGSESNPFTSFAAGFAYAVAQGLSSAIFRLSPGAVHTENIAFPTIGGQWEIECPVPYVNSTTAAQIVGTIVATNATAGLGVFRLAGVVVTGLISGVATGTTIMFLENMRSVAGLSLTTGAGGPWQLQCIGNGLTDPNHTSGSILAACSVAGRILAINFNFEGTVTDAPQNTLSQFWGCRFAAAAASYVLNGVANTGLRFYECTFEAAMTFTAATAKTIACDGISMSFLNQLGVTYAGAGVITGSTFNAQNSKVQLIANNVGATNVGGTKTAAGLYEAVATETLIAAGTAGTAVLNVIYTDLNGTLQTKAVVAGLPITAAVGTEASGSLVFRHNGATAIQFSVTGVVTPGALSINMAIAVMRRD